MTFKPGSLSRRSPGARGIGHLVENPRCVRLGVLTASGVRPTDVSKHVFGDTPQDGQSLFSIQRGNRFDARMSNNRGLHLLELYQERGFLPSAGAQSINIAEEFPKTDAATLRKREEATLSLLQHKLANPQTAPMLIIKPRICIELAGKSFAIEPDYLVASPEQPFYRVGEIKSYSDRHGQTDGRKLKSACLQSAVGAVALLQYLSCAGSSVRLESTADLVLAWPGSLSPNLRQMPIDGEIGALQTVLRELPNQLAQAEATAGSRDSLSEPDTIKSLPCHYQGSCLSFCGLAKVCRREAQSQGCPSLLGQQAQFLIPEDRNITELMQLVDGSLSPTTEDEAELVQTLQAAWGCYQEGLS